jgi:FlaG/FlaF family flagellin (archaellin)
MISITVILAAIVAAFVFGMAGSMASPKFVGGTVHKIDGTHIAVTYTGGQDAKMLKSINWSFSPIVGTQVGYFMDSPRVSGTSQLLVGTSYTATSANFSGSVHVVATAYFTDDTSQVILETIL